MSTHGSALDVPELTQRLLAQAYGLGFDAAGIASLGEPATVSAFEAWRAAGMHGSMAWLDGTGATLRGDTRRPHPGASHAIVVAASYGGRAPSGPVARYARGDDYHVVLRERVRELHHWLERTLGRPVNARPYVDSGPLLERDLAQRAGLGWFGKNTMLITPKAGAFLFLASLLVELELEPSAPFEADRCGRCTRCLDACPTGALVEPRVLDARQCISYLTIEHRDAIPEPLRASFGGLIYGCDICNDVCPWNERFTGEPSVPSLAPRTGFPASDDVAEVRAFARTLCVMCAAEYADTFRGSAIKRAKLWMLQRNACVALGNVGTAEDLPVLEALCTHEHPLVREHARWACERVGAADRQ